ncbi:hypothetical protein LXA43DRAFT_1098552 [Ganoderma leucocontextum]|nr:hypothetical protein LXA43DRAFT_1098552 [Ganoderma leucocontextum]
MWPQSCTWAEHLDLVRAWRDAPTDKNRDEKFDQHSLQWSELLRLPYWDPTKYTLLDTMHNLFLGELHHHCIALWGMKTAQGRTAPGTVPKNTLKVHSPQEQQACLEKLAAALSSSKPSVKTVALARKDYLSMAIAFNSIPFARADPGKIYYTTKLILAQGVGSIRMPPPLPYASHNFHLVEEDNEASDPENMFSRIFTGDVLDAIQKDIPVIHLPSWMERPPHECRQRCMIQKLKTNHKQGEIPGTFMRGFYVGAKLRWFMDEGAWPASEEF